MDQYEDIMYLPRHVSRTHKHMTNIDRAAQFAPFAALSGHEEAIYETARLTNEKIILDESQKEIIDRKLQYLDAHIALEPIVYITYFIKDHRKNGGSYQTMNGVIRLIDKIENKIIFKDKRKIDIYNILSIESELFEEIEGYYEEI